MSLANTIYCVSCTQIYDEEYRKPCIGLCSHCICRPCQVEKFQNKLTKCPICDMEGSFANELINYAGLEILREIRGNVTEENYSEFVKEVKDLGKGRCSVPTCASYENLRLCIPCSKAKDLLFEYPKNTWSLKSPKNMYFTGEKLFLHAKSQAVCANCFIEGSYHDLHEGHKHIPLLSIENVSTHLEVKYLLAHAQLVYENIRGRNTIDTRIDSTIKYYQYEAHNYEVWTKIDCVKTLRETIVFEDLKYSDLVDIKEKSFQKAKKIFEANDKLRAYHLRCHIGNLNKWILHFTEIPGLEKGLEELLKSNEKLLKLLNHSKFQLTQEEAHEILKEIKDRMLELEKEQRVGTFLEIPPCSIFFKHRALIQEIKDVKEAMDAVEKRIKAEDVIFEGFFEEFTEKLNIEDELSQIPEVKETRDYILHVDLVDKSLKIDEWLMKQSKVSRRSLMCGLIKVTYFSDLPEISGQRKIYNALINEVDDTDFWKDVDLLSC